MLRLFLAALLAAVAMPANAATYIEIKAGGSATGFYETTDSVFHDFEGWASGSAVIPIDGPLAGCWANIECYVSGNTFTIINNQVRNYSSIQLTFDHVLTGFPLSAAGFVSGRIYGRVLVPNRETINAGGTGIVNTLSITVLEGEVTATTSAGIVANIPEPATWAMMIAGFGLLGGALRRHGVSASLKSCISFQAKAAI